MSHYLSRKRRKPTYKCPECGHIFHITDEMRRERKLENCRRQNELHGAKQRAFLKKINDETKKKATSHYDQWTTHEINILLGWPTSRGETRKLAEFLGRSYWSIIQMRSKLRKGVVKI